MEQQNKHLASQLQAEAANWACDVLNLDPQVCTDSRKHANRQAVTQFFGSLKSRGFCTENDKAEAVELLLGKPAAYSPPFLKHLNQQGFQRLDGVIDWFANELGVMQESNLMDGMKERLSNLNLSGCSDDVHNYSKDIWQTATTVDRRIIASDRASLILLQAMFHISAVRKTQRCRVRSQWTKKLRREFSVSELAAAKKSILKKPVFLGDQFNRPFLLALAREGAAMNQLTLPPPVDSRSPTTGVRMLHLTETGLTSPRFDRLVKYSFLMIFVLLVAGFFFIYRPVPKPSTVIEAATTQEKTDKAFKIFEDRIENQRKYASNGFPSNQLPLGPTVPNHASIPVLPVNSTQNSNEGCFWRRAIDSLTKHNFDPQQKLNHPQPDSTGGVK